MKPVAVVAAAKKTSRAAATPAPAPAPVAPVKVTANELVLLKAIAAEAKRLSVDPVSTAVPCVNPFESKHVGSGTYASAMRKGLVESQNYGTVEHAVSLTELGLEASKLNMH